MANEQNLRELTTEEAREIGKKGGINSAKSRRRKADLRKMAQEIISGTYTDKNGIEITGEELIIKSLITNLSDPKGRNWSKAVDLLVELTGAKKTPEEIAQIKAETELIKAKTKQMTQTNGAQIADDGFLAALNGTAGEDWG